MDGPMQWRNRYPKPFTTSPMTPCSHRSTPAMKNSGSTTRGSKFKVASLALAVAAVAYFVILVHLNRRVLQEEIAHELVSKPTWIVENMPTIQMREKNHFEVYTPSVNFTKQFGTLPPSQSTATLNLPKEFPKWMRMYFNWHAKRRQTLNQINWKDNKYMILRCTHEDKKCGGLADRLKPLPYLLRVASEHRRIFMIRWDRPAKLENFLLPNKLDWSVPEWMVAEIESGNVTRRKKNNAKKWSHFNHRDQNALVVEGKIQDVFGAAEFYDGAVADPSDTYASVYHQVFRSLFKPSTSIEKLVKEKQAADGLIPGMYAVAHYRAYYGVEDRKETVSNESQKFLAINAANCASQLHNGGPIYFASDSQTAVSAVKEYATQYKYPISALGGDEALHIDKFSGDHGYSPIDFYSVFVDLLIMSDGACVSYGRGGFGRFAMLLSHNSSCENRHTYKSEVTKCDWTA